MTRLVVLRPEPGAAATVARAEAMGFAAIAAPLFAVTPLDWTPPEEPVDAVMMTSANAARHGGPGLARYRDLPLYAVGPETAAAARAAGFADIRAGPATPPPSSRRSAGASASSTSPAASIASVLPPDGLRRIVYAAEPVPAPPGSARAALAGARPRSPFPPCGRPVRHARRSRRPRPRRHSHRRPEPGGCRGGGLGWRSVAIASTPDDAALLRAIGATGD